MPDQILIIANPTSGGGRGRKFAELAAAGIRSRGGIADISFTSSQGDAARLVDAGRRQGVRCIAACGGDGTIHEVIGAIAGSDVALGVIPAGRGNDFARALGIPTDPGAAGSLIGATKPVRMDLGIVNGRYFGTVVTMGFDSEVARLVYDHSVPFKGTAAYVMGVLKMLSDYRGIEARFEGDFGVVEGPILLAATGNTPYYGGGMKIAPAASPGDGLLDLCHVKMMSRFGILKLLPKVFWGGHIGRPGVTALRTSTLRIETESPVWLFADGEPVCQTPAEISAAPMILSVIRPA